ncbi:angiopoietin-related protein 1-like [Denticeps clupeoides]|uniref:Fibrinogen C-terminal domain-containing protein n=1 Tax=Denticeps clupeoides TaxID=299321 RepID=A0AAY4AYA5_9TELE|nr:angiopoietin-related protein 1-like [Denticeps clupeoides]XP_028832544.1 angiopoietin-related protein 1-like [Denticeps clupeoides]
MKMSSWILCVLLCLSMCVGGDLALSRDQKVSGARRRRAPVPGDDSSQKECSYTFLVPEQKITGPICATQGSSLPDKDRVTRMDVADVRELLSKQRREMDMLRLLVDVDGNMVNEMKLLRKESRNMNSRVTQLYMQLLHEIIRKRDNSLELAQLEARVLNATAEALRLSARYRELEARFSTLAGVVNNQSVLIGVLEERCLQVYGNHRHEPVGPPLVQVVPENIPVSVPRLTNEIQRDHGRAFPRDRGSRAGPSPTGSTLEGQGPSQGNFSSDGPFRDCFQAMQAGHTTSGMFLLKPDGGERPLQAWCEHELDNGGWTVIHRRKDGSVNFFRNWESYTKGFGNIDGEHWLGLENIYHLGHQGDYRLMVEMEDWTEKKVYAEYSSFHLEPESQSYRLRLGTYQGNAGDSLSSHNGKQFTTLDRDKDNFSGNCAHFHKGGWWYNACGQTNLNGVWYSGGVYRSKFQDGIFWADYGGGYYSMKAVRMMIRPID